MKIIKRTTTTFFVLTLVLFIQLLFVNSISAQIDNPIFNLSVPQPCALCGSIDNPTHDCCTDNETCD